MKNFKYNAGGPTQEEYEILFNAAKGKQSVLEFGPGASTWAFIDANVPKIVSCEFKKKWYQKAEKEFKKRIQLLHFEPTQMPLQIPELENTQFDLVFVDSPPGVQTKHAIHIPNYEGFSRINTLLFALGCSDTIFLHDVHREGEQASLQLVKRLGYHVKIHDTVKGIAEIKPSC